jgi:translocator protein
MISASPPTAYARHPRVPVQILALVGFLVACFAVAGLGAAWTASSLDAWYPALNKPSWNPPNWIFGPVWSLLYLMMATSAWLVWRVDDPSKWRALGLFAVQLLLNLAWSGIFFGLRQPGLAFGEILLLWAAIAATIWSFRRYSGWAAALLVPYLAWVTFASILNFAIWRLNV